MVKNNYITIFEKLLDIIDWQKLKESTYLLDTNYYIAQNHLKALIYFHVAQLDSLRDIHDFMKSDSDLKELINGVSIGYLSNYNNDINFEVYVPLMNQIIATAMNKLPVNNRAAIFKPVKLIDSSTISMALSYFEMGGV
ncbi:DUF4372 domain-containing protein [Alkaliphilus metalliredigens]|uniref:DUF4372 domain-containing protein n=1 Tax=Alkaliphilus metalliredigens TaxID=208226 RepID=UPI00005CB5EB|nr:DUF4372 domain-containing protein [Alkaliphilus metalliredigens]